MKKNKVFLSLIVLLALCSTLWGYEKCNDNSCFTLDLTTGYVFKHDDCNFKRVYGHGIENIITVDGCYYWWELWGMGAKVSYWHAKGRTSFFKQRTHLYEVPLTFYVRRKIDWECGLQAYASLGGGAIFIKEKSYLGCVDKNKGIGEFEVGLYYQLCSCFDITTAFRYLFPHERLCGAKADVGGFDLRAGIGFSY